MAGLQRRTIDRVAEVLEGGPVAVGDFVATLQRHAPSAGRAGAIDLLCRLVNHGHVRIDDDVVTWIGD